MCCDTIFGNICAQNRHAPEVSEGNCHARLSHSKQLLKKYSSSEFTIIIVWRNYASAVLGVVILSIHLSVRHTRDLWLIQRTDWRYFYTTRKGNPSSFLMPKISAKFQQGHPQQGHQREGWLKRRFRPISGYTSQTLQNRDIVTMEC